MKIRLALLASAVLVVAGFAAMVPSAQARQGSPARATRTAVQNKLPILVNGGHKAGSKAGTVSTLNWAGYVVGAPANHAITAVHSTIVVPNTRSNTPGGAAIWTGIGGSTTADLIQAGVSVGDLLQGGASYAWYEILPQTETPLFSGCSNGDSTCAVNPGDTVHVDISQIGSTRWAISLNNYHHWTWSRSLDYGSSRSSAEWILEAPSVIVAPTIVPMMDNALFGPGNTFALDHHAAQKLGTGSPVAYDMAALGIIPEAQPSAMAQDQDGFAGCAFKSSCPAPAA